MQAGGRRFDPVILHQDSFWRAVGFRAGLPEGQCQAVCGASISGRGADGFALSLKVLGFGFDGSTDHEGDLLFFNNWEEAQRSNCGLAAGKECCIRRQVRVVIAKHNLLFIVLKIAMIKGWLTLMIGDT